jgi:hypothetical protein
VKEELKKLGFPQLIEEIRPDGYGSNLFYDVRIYFFI